MEVGWGSGCVSLTQSKMKSRDCPQVFHNRGNCSSSGGWSTTPGPHGEVSLWLWMRWKRNRLLIGYDIWLSLSQVGQVARGSVDVGFLASTRLLN